MSKDTLVFTLHDDILWVKISPSVLSLNNDLYICLCYVVPDDGSRQAMIETNIFDHILECIVYIESKAQSEFNMLICGDFNGCTSNKPDFVLDHESHHMNVLPDIYTPDQFMNRYSQDITVGYYCWIFVNRLGLEF